MGRCLVERGGGEKSGGANKFSLPPPPSKYNLSKLERKLEWKVGKIFEQNCHTSFNISGFFFFFTFPFSINAGFLFLFLFFFFFFVFLFFVLGFSMTWWVFFLFLLFLFFYFNFFIIFFEENTFG